MWDNKKNQDRRKHFYPGYKTKRNIIKEDKQLKDRIAKNNTGEKVGILEFNYRVILVMPIGLIIAAIGYAIGFWCDLFIDGLEAGRK